MSKQKRLDFRLAWQSCSIWSLNLASLIRFNHEMLCDVFSWQCAHPLIRWEILNSLCLCLPRKGSSEDHAEETPDVWETSHRFSQCPAKVVGSYDNRLEYRPWGVHAVCQTSSRPTDTELYSLWLWPINIGNCVWRRPWYEAVNQFFD